MLQVVFSSCSTSQPSLIEIQEEIDKENYELALALCDSLLKNESDNAELYVLKSQSLMGLSQFEKAIKELTHALTLGKVDEEIYYLLGHAQYKAGKFEEALLSFTFANELDNTILKLNYKKGLCFLELEDYDYAIKYFKKEIELNPTFAESYFGLAEVYILTNKDDELVEKNINIGLRYRSDNQWAYLSLGIINFRKENYKEAISFFDKAIEIDSTYAEAYDRRAIIYGIFEEYDNSIKQSSLSIKYDPDYLDAYITRAISYEMIDDNKNACKDYLFVLSKDSSLVSKENIELCETYMK